MYYYLSFIFIFGTIIGSFINVCIWRIPRDLSLFSPRSHCTHCLQTIKWYDNIPVMSFLILRGQCRFCGKSISIQYFCIELLTGILFLLIALKYPFSSMLPVFLFIAFLLITISGIDFFHKIIPDLFSYVLIITGLLSSPINPILGNSIQSSFISSIVGGIIGLLLLSIIAFAGKKLLKQEAMGGGDIKLLAGIGTFLGPLKVISTLFYASLIGSVVGIILILFKLKTKKDYIPFGPFIAIAAYLNLFVSESFEIFKIFLF